MTLENNSTIEAPAAASETSPLEAGSARDFFAYWVERLNAAFEGRDADAFAALVAEDSFWRDVLSFTWDRPTFEGRDAIRAAFAAHAAATAPSAVRIAEARTAPRFSRYCGQPVIEGWFDFQTAVGTGAGFARLLYDPSQPRSAKAWVVLTSLYSLDGFEEKTGAARPSGEHYSKIETPISWRQEREREQGFADRDPQVLVVGAGQSGLILAARLKQMGVDALVVEQKDRVGDVWRGRYNNLTLHNKLNANHFPYLPFPETWPTWLPKDMLGDWLESYARLLELNVWTGTRLSDAEYDEAAGEWSIGLALADGSERRMRCPHLVIATGVSGSIPKKPDLPGLRDFKGTVLHSGEFKTGADWVGRQAIVVGTGNSGHDIAQDLYVSGAKSVSILQRGATCVLSLEPSAVISYSIYNDEMPVEDVDLMVASIPHRLLLESYKHITRRTKEYDKDLIAGLNAIGFKTHNGEDETGFQLLYLRGAGGYYIDVGCAELLMERKVGLVQADDTEQFVADGLRLKDGSVVPLDLVVLATGFEGLQESVRRMLGDTVADRVGRVWGFDEQGNVRNMWTRTGQPGLWLMGGAILEARLNSRYLALQIKASLEGLLPPSPVSGE